MQTFHQNIVSLYGLLGEEWLAKLPDNVAFATAKWGLSHLQPISELSFHYVCKGLQNDRPIVLKLGIDHASLAREAQLLQYFAGRGAVELLAQVDGALLLQQAQPGVSMRQSWLAELGRCTANDSLAVCAADAALTHQAAVAMLRLQQGNLPFNGKLPTLEEWLLALDRAVPQATDDLKTYLTPTLELRDQLLKTSQAPAVLHGDLHHDNFVQHGADWLIIDPKGVRGELAFAAAAYLCNPKPELLEHVLVKDLIAQRLTIFAKAWQLDTARLAAWCLVYTVLAWVWALEDGLDPGYFRRAAQLIREIVPMDIQLT